MYRDTINCSIVDVKKVPIPNQNGICCVTSCDGYLYTISSNSNCLYCFDNLPPYNRMVNNDITIPFLNGAFDMVECMGYIYLSNFQEAKLIKINPDTKQFVYIDVPGSPTTISAINISENSTSFNFESDHEYYTSPSDKAKYKTFSSPRPIKRDRFKPIKKRKIEVETKSCFIYSSNENLLNESNYVEHSEDNFSNNIVLNNNERPISEDRMHSIKQSPLFIDNRIHNAILSPPSSNMNDTYSASYFKNNQLSKSLSPIYVPLEIFPKKNALLMVLVKKKVEASKDNLKIDSIEKHLDCLHLNKNNINNENKYNNNNIEDKILSKTLKRQSNIIFRHKQLWCIAIYEIFKLGNSLKSDFLLEPNIVSLPEEVTKPIHLLINKTSNSFWLLYIYAYNNNETYCSGRSNYVLSEFTIQNNSNIGNIPSLHKLRTFNPDLFVNPNLDDPLFFYYWNPIYLLGIDNENSTILIADQANSQIIVLNLLTKKIVCFFNIDWPSSMCSLPIYSHLTSLTSSSPAKSEPSFNNESRENNNISFSLNPRDINLECRSLRENIYLRNMSDEDNVFLSNTEKFSIEEKKNEKFSILIGHRFNSANVSGQTKLECGHFSVLTLQI